MKLKDNATDILTVRLDKASKRRLEDLAGATARSKSFLACEAIRNYLDLQAWQVEGIKQALKEADEGRFADPSRVKSIFKKYRAA